MLFNDENMNICMFCHPASALFLNLVFISPQVEVQSLLAAEVMGGAKNTAQKSSLKSLSHLWEPVSRARRTETHRQ